MYSDTIVLSGPDVMLSSSASVAASHSPRPLSAPIGPPGSASATEAAAVSRMSALRGAGQLTVPFGTVSATRQRSPLAAPQDQPAARARVDDRVGRYLVHGQDEVIEPRPGQPGVRALRGDLAP